MGEGSRRRRLVMSGLVALPGLNAGATSKPTVRRAAVTTAATVTPASKTAPLVSAYPPRGPARRVPEGARECHHVRPDAEAGLQAGERRHGRGARRVGLRTSCRSSSGCLPQQSRRGMAEHHQRTARRATSRPTRAPTRSANLPRTSSPASPPCSAPRAPRPRPMPARWCRLHGSCPWDNLFDYQPLMRSSTGQTGQ